MSDIYLLFSNRIGFVGFANQETERKVRRQFKGLFDKNPGEIAGAGAEDEQTVAKDLKDAEKVDSDSDKSEESHEAVDDARREGWFSAVWPGGRRLFTALGLQRCNIL